MNTRTRSHLLTSLAAITALGFGAGCSSSDGQGPGEDGPPAGLECGDKEIEEDGKCVLDPFRYEPVEQLDQDNILYYSDQELTILTDLPPAPKSGFRLVMEPQDVPAGYDSESNEASGITDVSPCQSWPVPDLSSRWVYTAVVHTTPGLHHANMYGIPIDPTQGPQPYPNCRQSADSLVFGQVRRYITGIDPQDLLEPAVLFANSTQVIGTSAEKYALADGYAYEIPEGMEIATSTHLQNTTPNDLHVEAAWDFYTMPSDLVTNQTAMFVYIHFGFLLPPRQEKSIHGNCSWGGGDVLAIMPHTHQWATGFVTEFGTAPTRDFDGMPQPGFDQFESLVQAYDRAGTGLTDSDIELYDPPLETDGTNAVRFQCKFNNTTDHDMVFGVGENEMCFLFGYTSPPESRGVGLMLDEAASCVNIRRDAGRFDIAAWLETQTEEARNGFLDGANLNQ